MLWFIKYDCYVCPDKNPCFLLHLGVAFTSDFFSEGVINVNVQKVLEARACCCACVYGESLLTSGERGIQE